MAPKDTKQKEKVAPKRKDQSVNEARNRQLRKRKREISQGRVLNNRKEEIKSSKKKKSLHTVSASKETDVTTAVHEVSENEKVLLTSEGSDCSICLDTYESKEFMFLPCTHRFHIQCIGKWMHIKERCPLCKTRVFASFRRPYSRRKARVF